MEFCPSCGLMLQIEPARSGRPMCLSCPVCPYFCVPRAKLVKTMPLVRKEIEPVFSESDSKKSLPKAIATCPKCHNNEAYSHQMQTRSADEAATIFYKCCNESCNHQWRED